MVSLTQAKTWFRKAVKNPVVIANFRIEAQVIDVSAPASRRISALGLIESTGF